jgi:hypothetical protein
MHEGARGDFVPDGLAGELARGIMRAFGDLGQACLAEFRLGNGRRVDVMAVDRGGLLTAVEIKTSAGDYRADRKWWEYLPYCDSFYFAVAEDFDRALLPGNVGVMVADRYTATILRPSREYAMHPSRRKALVLRFARTAGRRLMRLNRPDYT